jgi:hypothetical protein
MDEKIYLSNVAAARALIEALPPIVDSFFEYSTNLTENLKEIDFVPSSFKPWQDLYQLSFNDLLIKAAVITGDIRKLMEISQTINKVDANLSLFKFVGPEKMDSQFQLNRDFGTIYALQKSLESIIYHQRTMSKLIRMIENGFDTNDNLLQKLLQIDKTAIHLPCVMNRIKVAQIKEDEVFFRKIGNVMMNRSPLKVHKDAYLTFAVFWLLDLNLYDCFTEHDKYELLKGFNLSFISEDSFAKKVRKISSLY